jgi:hypothetical protein
LLSIWVLIKEKKYKLLILIAIPLAIIGIRKIFLQTLDTAGVYNLITWNFNAVSVEKYFDWIYINYGLMFALFLAGMLFISFKQIKKYILEIYVIANLLFIFGYVGNVPHNFGFREFFFFLPVLFIISIINLKRIFSKYKLVVYFILGIIVISNFYAIIAYPVNYEGAKYYTTKPLFEKMDINIGNKDMASFVNNYTNYSTNYKIVYIGLGEDLFNYYLKDNIRVYTTFRDSVLGKANIQDLKDFISKNKGSDILIVISANAYANRVNWLYYYIWNGRKYVTEISTSFEDYVEKSANSSEIYKSKDGFSKIYLYRA